MNRLQGHVAVITGGASGIGQASANLFAAEGAAGVIGDLAEQDAAAAAAQITAAGGRAVGVAIDVTDEASLAALVEAGGGSIINTASVGGLSGDFTQTAYGTAKAAVLRLTQYVANQYGHERIRCTRSCPAPS